MKVIVTWIFFVLEIVDAAGRRDLQARLRQGGSGRRFIPHEAIGWRHPPNQTVQGVLPLRPMLRRAVREAICRRPMLR